MDMVAQPSSPAEGELGRLTASSKRKMEQRPHSPMRWSRGLPPQDWSSSPVTDIDAKVVAQLSRSIARNSRLMLALTQIANKTKMDAVAAVAMRAIARDAVKGNDDGN